MIQKKAIKLMDRLKGLMFEKTGEIELEIELLKETRYGASIHTLFMNYPIKAEFYNEKRQLVDSIILEPWKLNYTPFNKAKFIIEKKFEKEYKKA